MQYAWKYIEEESWLPWLRFTWQNVTLQINYEVSFFLANLKLYMVPNIYRTLLKIALTKNTKDNDHYDIHS